MRNHNQALTRRNWHNSHIGSRDDAQSAFGTDDDFRQIELPGIILPTLGPNGHPRDEFVKIVAAHPPEDSWIPGNDLFTILSHQIPHRFVQISKPTTVFNHRSQGFFIKTLESGWHTA